MLKKCNLKFLSLVNAQTSVSAFPPQSSAQHNVESVKPEAGKVASYSSEEGNNDISPGDMEFSDMESPLPAKKPAMQQTTVSAPKAQSDAHGSSSNDAKAPQVHTPETKPAAKPDKPAQPAPAAQPVAPVQAVAPAQPAMPAQPVAPVQPVTPAQPAMPAPPVAPAQPVSLPAQTIESTVGQSNGFISQSAPLTASYNPAVAAPNLASMSRYFDSPSNSPNVFAPQPYYQPMPKLQAPQQKFAPNPEPKKPAAPKNPAPAKPAATPYAAFNVSIRDQPVAVLK